MPDDVVKDALGAPLEVGDQVVYAHSGYHGASARVWVGVIDRLDTVKQKIRLKPSYPNPARPWATNGARWLWPQAVIKLPEIEG